MSIQKKFGAFAGVFTPSLLTILGVIMYMRLGWVVGQAGLIGSIMIIVIAHVISITTGLSISSIATDKKVGAGGVYYVLSRSLGLPIGGAIGMTLFTGTALSIALYLIGFAESFNPYFGLDAGINGLRLGGSLALLIMTIIALISTSFALKTQFFIMAAIVLSLISIFLGVSPEAPTSLSYLPGSGSVSMETVFAIFFPAVTGFTAGIAMSGDLKDPKKAIPRGTLWAIGVGFVVYVGLATFIFFSVDQELLRTDNNILLKLALFAPAVVAGIWGATLSSALGGILGGPRILQAMSVDKITPKFFAKGVGKGNDPRNALIFTVLIAEAGILIGELDTIARICSMFYLAAYGFINLSFFLESWASSDFNPSFKVKKWVGLAGFIATFVVMFRLDMLAMVAAFVVIGGIYFWLAKKQLALGSGDVWQSVWSSVVKTGLRRMDDKQEHQRNWKPNVLLFSGGTTHRPHLLEFSKELVGHRGIVTNFDLYENQEAKLLFPKHQQSVNDEVLKKYGVFGRRLEVKNIFKGIESIASTFGFSGIEPNTILMGWAKNTADPIWFAQMTQKLMDLDYNVLYLDYDDRFGFRNYAQIDLWWRGVGRNAELMLNISKFLVASELWRNAQIRILLVDDTNSNIKIIEKKIRHLLEEHRVSASIKVIGNATEHRELYELMKIYSSDTDLVLVGIPEVQLEEAGTFVGNTNDLVSTIGTTLLVKASTQFNEIALLSPQSEQVTQIDAAEATIPDVVELDDQALRGQLIQLDQELTAVVRRFSEEVFGPIQDKYLGLFQAVIREWEGRDLPGTDVQEVMSFFEEQLSQFEQHLQSLQTGDLRILVEMYAEHNQLYLEELNAAIKGLPKRVRYTTEGLQVRIPLRQLGNLQIQRTLVPMVLKVYRDFGYACYSHLAKTTNEVISKIYHLCQWEGFSASDRYAAAHIDQTKTEIIHVVQEHAGYFQGLKAQVQDELLKAVRQLINDMLMNCQSADPVFELRQIRSNLDKRRVRTEVQYLTQFPQQWGENQEALHSTSALNLTLARVNLMIGQQLELMLARLQTEVNLRVADQIRQHGQDLAQLPEEHVEDADLSVFDAYKHAEGPAWDINPFMAQISTISAALQPLLHHDSVVFNRQLFEDFQQYQLEGMTPVTLDMPRILDFILETKLFEPVQRLVERYLQEVAALQDQQFNRVILLRSTLAEEKSSKISRREIRKLLQTMKERNQMELEEFQSRVAKLEEGIRTVFYELHLELDSRYLVEHAENWDRFITISKRKAGLQVMLNRIRSAMRNGVKDLARIFQAKQHESEVSEFLTLYEQKTDLERGLHFVQDFLPPKKVLSQLPFYYKQLFLGKHLPVQSEYIGRQRELRAFDAWKDEKSRGALLIAGKSGSGKTHFSRYLAQQLKTKGNELLELSGRQGTLQELKRLIHTGTNAKGSIEECLDQLPSHSVILVNDLEVWWDRTRKEDACQRLIQVVERYQKKHFFILNVNLFALSALREHRPLGRVITNTIILTPMSDDDLIQMVLERHQIGGLDLVYKGEKNPYHTLAFRRYLRQFVEKSHGNAGRTLQLWLRSIITCSNHEITIDRRADQVDLQVRRAGWKWMIYQLILSRHLTRDEIIHLFEGDTEAIHELLYELERSQVIQKEGSQGFILNPVVRPVVEYWLEQHSFFH